VSCGRLSFASFRTTHSHDTTDWSQALDEVEFLKHVYHHFNARDMETVLAAMHENVMWANGMEGGHVHGRDAVRDYWTRQWAMIDPHVEPVAFSKGPRNEVIVEVHQVVHDLNGNLLLDQMVGHIFTIEDGLVRRFDIRGA
jgi:nuclear transport factor 2 (NTF2) superfamily protein